MRSIWTERGIPSSALSIRINGTHLRSLAPAAITFTRHPVEGAWRQPSISDFTRSGSPSKLHPPPAKTIPLNSDGCCSRSHAITESTIATCHTREARLPHESGSVYQRFGCALWTLSDPLNLDPTGPFSVHRIVEPLPHYNCAVYPRSVHNRIGARGGGEVDGAERGRKRERRREHAKYEALAEHAQVAASSGWRRLLLY